jgi:hypothetical protein
VVAIVVVVVVVVVVAAAAAAVVVVIVVVDSSSKSSSSSSSCGSSSVLAVHLGLVLLSDEGQRDVYLLYAYNWCILARGAVVGSAVWLQLRPRQTSRHRVRWRLRQRLRPVSRPCTHSAAFAICCSITFRMICGMCVRHADCGCAGVLLFPSRGCASVPLFPTCMVLAIWKTISM